MKYKVIHKHHRYGTEEGYIVKTKKNNYGQNTYKARYRKHEEGLYPQYRGAELLRVVDTGDEMIVKLPNGDETAFDYVQWAALSSIFDVEKREEFEHYSSVVELKNE